MSKANCKKELTKRSADWVRERINGGAEYFLVLGHPYNDDQLNERKAGLLEAVSDLGMPITEDQITVIDSNQLALWVSSIPAVALNPLFKGPRWNLIDHAQWSGSSRHDDTWIDASKKVEAVHNLREALDRGAKVLRIQGPSRTRKTLSGYARPR